MSYAESSLSPFPTQIAKKACLKVLKPLSSAREAGEERLGLYKMSLWWGPINEVIMGNKSFYVSDSGTIHLNPDLVGPQSGPRKERMRHIILSLAWWPVRSRFTFTSVRCPIKINAHHRQKKRHSAKLCDN
ncbi:hypothetical protein AVEN_61040-1 [Araneus ventricosus]|uniref:Uncharacterized protein n=1 Tax=Araneus ventricosus TaxID=182803 RepID=A0A4Y2DY15_ARAVE|nr:hypothetical protein AVEN_61040-1 [Araneus ventricosus]